MHIKGKSFLSILLAILLILPSLSISGKALSVEDIKAVSDKVTQEIIEEKVICDATIDDEFSDNSVIVVLKKDTNPNFKTLTQSDFPEIKLKKIDNLTEDIEPLIKTVRKTTNTETISSAYSALDEISAISEVGITNSYENGAFNIYSTEELQELEQGFNQIIKIDLEDAGKQNVLDAIKELEKRDDILIAQPNYIYSVCSTTPNDPNVSYQWAIDIMDLNEAWDITTGSSDVLVGIMDSGIDIYHEDLAANINTTLAKDFTQEFNDYSSMHPHGTHVAGIVGAVGNNGTDVTGVCWKVKMVDLQVFDSFGNGETAALVNAIKYATAKNIPILNLSGGGAEEDEALKEAIENYPGLLVCAAGNYEKETDNRDNDVAPFYPASYNYDNIISVAATDSNDLLWGKSFYGQTSVDLAAPGVDIYSTLQDDNVGRENGTSMAAPQVTGVAALLKSKFPSITTAQMKQTILNTVDEVSSLSSKCVTGGRLNANNALRKIYNKYFTVRYAANGGTGSMADTKVYYDILTKTRENTFTREGYDFDCWNIQRSYDGKWRYQNADKSESGWYNEGEQPEGWIKYRYANGVSVAKTTSAVGVVITFHAQWKKYFTVRYAANGGTGSMADTKVYYDVLTQTRENTFTREGYDFDCWNIQRSYDGKWRYQNADKSESGWYNEGEQPEGWIKYRYANGVSIAKTTSAAGVVITFHAQWKKYFTVRYAANGGTGSMADTKVYYDVLTQTRENTFTREGYDFDCWNIQRSYDGKWRYQNADKSESGWYNEGEQPEGWIKYRYANGVSVSKTTSAAGVVITFHAQWIPVAT